MEIRVRRAIDSDAAVCGQILYSAFKEVADKYNFPRPFIMVESAVSRIKNFLNTKNGLLLVALAQGQVVGSLFVDRRCEVGGIGPLSVHPKYQNRGVGRRLVHTTIIECKNHKALRLTQDAFNLASGAFYSSLGFEVREPVVVMQGRLNRPVHHGRKVGLMKPRDIDECSALYKKIHKVDRAAEIVDSLRTFSCFVVKHKRRITGYSSALARWGHGVAETREDLEALISGIHVKEKNTMFSLNMPVREPSIFKWCLDQGMRMVKPLNLLTLGFYQEPQGFFYISGRY